MPNVLVTDEKPSAPPSKKAVMEQIARDAKAFEEMPKASEAKIVVTPPVGGWAGDTPPSLGVVPVVEAPNPDPLPAPEGVPTFSEFALRYFTGNLIRDEAYANPKSIRSIAADCLTAYHAFIYTLALGLGVTNKSPEGRRFGGPMAIHADIRGAVARMDREMDGR